MTITGERLDELHAALHGVLRPDQVLTSKSDRFNRARVPAPFPVHRWAERVPDVVTLPESTEDVAAIVRIANALRVPIVPRDGGTGLTDGAVPLHHGILVDVKRMNQIHELDLDNRTCTVGTGINMLKLNEVLGRARPDLSGQPGVVPVLPGRRTHRHERLVAHRVAVRTQPRPRAQLRSRAPHRRDHARR